MEVPARGQELEPTLVEVAERIARHRGSHIGEQNTKIALIVPVLRALGWDVEDLDQVQLEYRRQPADRPVDFALLLQREPVLFIEAKGLDENLNDRRWASQIITYASVAGVDWVVLTNGDEYRIYNAHAPVPFEDKLFRAVRISAAGADAADALRLLRKEELRSRSLATLWRAQSIDNRVRQAVEALFEPEPSPWLVRRLATTLDGLTQGGVKAALSRARFTLDIPSAEPGASSAPVESVEDEVSTTVAPTPSPAAYGVTVKNLIDAGLVRAGTPLRKRYLGQDLSATVEPDGRIRFNERIYDSLSVAAGMARVAVKGPPANGRRFYQTNGWTFWECETETGGWHPIDVFRQRFLKRNSAK